MAGGDAHFNQLIVDGLRPILAQELGAAAVHFKGGVDANFNWAPLCLDNGEKLIHSIETGAIQVSSIRNEGDG